MTNPWETVLDTIGDDNPDKIYLQVGKALSQWELLETAIAHIYSNLLIPGPGMQSMAASMAFGSIIGSGARNDMIGEVVKIVFSVWPMNEHQDLRIRTETLLDKMGKFSGRRNEIAHGCVTHFTDEKSNVGWFLFPAYYNTNKHKGDFVREPKYKFNAKTVAYYSDQFADLYAEANAIHNFLVRMHITATLKNAAHNQSGAT